jgi:hypothetical protein
MVFTRLREDFKCSFDDSISGGGGGGGGGGSGDGGGGLMVVLVSSGSPAVPALLGITSVVAILRV